MITRPDRDLRIAKIRGKIVSGQFRPIQLPMLDNGRPEPEEESAPESEPAQEQHSEQMTQMLQLLGKIAAKEVPAPVVNVEIPKCSKHEMPQREHTPKRWKFSVERDENWRIKSITAEEITE